MDGNGWIAVGADLPPTATPVLCAYAGSGEIFVGEYNDSNRRWGRATSKWGGEYTIPPTHWQRLPEPPALEDAE